jgi:hypothetical protein
MKWFAQPSFKKDTLSSMFPRVRDFVLIAIAGSVVVTATPCLAKDAVDFSAQIRPIISAKCYHCHGPDEESRKAKLRLDSHEEAIKDRDGSFAIKPGDLKNSELVKRITSTDPDEVMPPPKAGHPLTSQEIELLKKWVQQGAPYSAHWAFQKPQKPTLPKIKNRKWPKNEIDYFICEKLEENRLKPSPAADRYALVRRLSLDLTGLPPTPAEVEEFVQDKSANAYEKLVDRLLASPAFGEKWARMWLDIARYADSAGYGSDPLRLNVWPYRDWLIKALNSNMPYDRFTLEQLAGDLLENPTDEQMTATAFHRNTMTNTEGGTDDEEWRVAAVKDRANVTAQAWMGLTMGCAQCHTHKFDPITQKEYYQFYAFFNQTEDSDQPNERPTFPLPTPEQREKMELLTAKIAALEKELNGDSKAIQNELEQWQSAASVAGGWIPLQMKQIKSAGESSFVKNDDLSVTIDTNKVPGKDTYTIITESSKPATAVRLEVFPDAQFPGGGSGLSARGGFVLNDFTASVKPDSTNLPVARFVRIELPGDERILSLAEVQVFQGTTNLASGGSARQSDTDHEGDARFAIDGNTDGNFAVKSTTHTKSGSNPWWEVDLGGDKTFDAIAVWNRSDGDVGNRLTNFRIVALDANRKPVWATRIEAQPKPSVRVSLAEEHTLVLHRATATYSQEKFNIVDLTNDKPGKRSGWGVGGEAAKPQHAIFETIAPIPPGKLTFKLVQNYGSKNLIGKFRLSTGSLPSPAVVVPGDIAKVLSVSPDQRTKEQNVEAVRWFQQYATSTAGIRQKLDSAKAELAAIQPVAVPVMKELQQDGARITRFLNKGNFLDPGEPVTPGVPAAFHPWPAGAPTNRIGVARWVMSPENPLTPRVAVNRFWSQLFGLGLVETEEDFGTQGTLPTHRELLDWLAVDFRDNGWDMKRLIKTIVLSATYQQTSRVTPELLEKDPRNLLLSRAPRRRLDAETVRDQALALSALMSKKIGGPSVYPPQPDGLWRAAFNGQRSYPTSTGEDRYRRGLYTIWRRTVPYPSMATFDAPSREACTFRRLPTNTPLQAYVTMNDPVFVEASQALARRMIREGGTTPEQRIRFGLQLVLARPALDPQVAALMKLYNSESAAFATDEKEALKLATQPIGALPEGLTAAEAATWTVIANVLLNLDGVLTKG